MSNYCNSCNSCNSCNYCNYCYYCNYCDYCHYCDSCDYCHYCNYCDSCKSCKSCYNCKNLRATEDNYFCWAKECNDTDSSQQKRYRVFNVEVSKEEYENIKKIYHKLEFDKNESSDTRFQTAFKKMWNGLTDTEKQEYYDIPHFNWEGFTFITGVKQEDVTL